LGQTKTLQKTLWLERNNKQLNSKQS
jgi:hypothetical protein